MSSNEHALSRRKFLGAAGAASAAATLSLRAVDAAPVPVPEAWDLEADVVVLGSGGAGTTAAIEAARAGASVLIIEKATNPGGNTAHSGGVVYLGGGTPIQESNGFTETPEAFFTYLKAQMGLTQNEERLRYFVDNAVEHFHWLSDAGVGFGTEFWPGKVVQPSSETGGLAFSGNEENSPFSELTDPVPHGHMPPGAGAAVYKALKDTADQLPSIEWAFNTRGERLILDEKGAVAGVLVRTGIIDPSTPTDDGSPIAGTVTPDSQLLSVKANGGVVLATGGFQFNDDMLAKHAPWYMPGFGLGGPHLGDDGSGIQMGVAVGGEAVNMSFGSPWNFIYAPGELCKGVLVDGAGRRVVSETSYGADVGNAVFRHSNGIGWLIFDQATLDEATNAGAVLSEPYAVGSTLTELADKLKVPAAVLENTVAFYNEHAANGEDPILHKHAEYLQPLETGPFTAFDYGVNKGIPYITLGGLRSNMDAQILDVFEEPIPGLYGAGRVAPGLSQEYYVSGSAVADCTFWGRVAGKSAAAQVGAAE